MNFQNTFQQLEQPSKANLSCYTYIGDSNGSYPRHCHSYYELSYIFHGSRYEILNSKRYEVGDYSLLFIPPLAIHQLANQTEVEDLVIQFSHQFLRNASVLFEPQCVLKTAVPEAYLIPVMPKDSAYSVLEQMRILSLERQMLYNDQGCAVQKKFSLDLRLNSLCLELISILLKDYRLKIDTQGTTYSEILSLDPLINEILTHPGKLVNMRDASHMTGMSYSHFSRVFEKTTGFHYNEFCNVLRIREAEELLLTTNRSITEIAASLGISTIPYFTRLFRRINGTTPSMYRKQYR